VSTGIVRVGTGADAWAGGSELIVKVIDVKDPLKVQLLAGHKKAVREATWSPDGSLLVCYRVARTRRD
jgi:chromosome transmission fidelity protein 4